MIRVLSEQAPQKEVAESESGDKGEFNNAPTIVAVENKEEGQPVNKPVKHQTVQIRKRRSK